MSSSGWINRTLVELALAAVVGLNVGLTVGCQRKMTAKPPSVALRDINAVLSDHAQDLMAITGVVGVYVGLLDDGKTPCLKVMLARKDAQLKRAIPRQMEGHPVITEVTGEIRPIKSP